MCVRNNRGNLLPTPLAAGRTVSKQVLLRHPSVQTTCSGSYWCTVVCTLVRLCKEVLPQQHSGQHENLKSTFIYSTTLLISYSSLMLKTRITTSRSYPSATQTSSRLHPCLSSQIKY
uniref:Uncharacterized protein n=1 Tax=Seriola dumerili TaxID=41447 RepID=A0A3B4UUJ5_SERDU